MSIKKEKMSTTDIITEILNTEDPLFIILQGLSADGYINEAARIANIVNQYAEQNETITGKEVMYVFEQFWFEGVISVKQADRIASKIRHPSSGVLV